MATQTVLLPAMQAILDERFGNSLGDFLIPPPVFHRMKGQFLHFNSQEWALSARFPILNEYLNPYGTLQGGIISALIDNTIGPLSFLAARPNVTRHLEVTFNRSITPDLAYVEVTARLSEQNHPKLTFKAAVRDPEGNLMARARATHYILSSTESSHA